MNGVGVGPRPRSASHAPALPAGLAESAQRHKETGVGWRGEVKIIFRLHLLLQAVPIGVI